MSRPSVVVIGAGVIGLTTAWELVRRGADVRVISSPDQGRAVSWGSVAWSNVSGKVRLGYPDHYSMLNQHGMAAGVELSRELGGTPWLHVTGAVEIVDGTDDAVKLSGDLNRLRDFGYVAESLDPERFRDLLPGVQLGANESAAYFPSDGWIDAPALLENLADHLVGAGVSLQHDDVVGAEREGDRIAALRLASGGRISADNYVIAAGAWSGSLGGLLGVKVPILPIDNPRVPGLVAAATRPDTWRSPILISPGVIIRPFGPNRVMLAGDSHGHAIDVRSSRADLFAAAQVLLERATARAPQFAGSAILDVRLGLRPIPEDGVTIAGVPSDTSNAYIVTTHSGFTLAPLLSRLVAHEIIDNTDSTETLFPYRPSRFDEMPQKLAMTRVDSASA